MLADKIIDYCPESVKVDNLDALPRGAGCQYLVVIDSPYDHEYIAKRWARVMPKSLGRAERVIRF